MGISKQNKQGYLNDVIIFLREETMPFLVCHEEQCHYWDRRYLAHSHITPAALKKTRIKI
jgi:hypothetical protein